jgi:hypothetical protein
MAVLKALDDSASKLRLVGMMYPAYLRGQAYLHARNGKEAAAEFQRIISHRESFSTSRSPRWPTSD